jgi:hypothetical protein
MSDHIEVNGKKYFEESYLELANNNIKRAQGRITELSAQLLTAQLNLKDAQDWNVAYRERIELGQQLVGAFMWKPITPESLPKDGDEVGGFDSFPYVLDVVTYAAIKDYDTWRSRCMTHFRPLNEPERKA